MRTVHFVAVLACVLGVRPAWLSAAPLDGLPGRAGVHVAKIGEMRADTWLDLGRPTPDPAWGSPRGRSWGASMPYAPDLRAAFLFGEGVHGWWDRDTGRYMDDLWAYDANAHRWVCVHPGTDVRTVDLRLNERGLEVTKDGQPVPVAQMVHGYQGTTYDPDRRQFLFMPCPGGYWDQAMGERRMRWLKEKRNEVAKDHGPWAYDVRTGRWDRRPTAGPAPAGGFGDVLVYVPSVKRVFLRHRADVWWYDPADNTWAKAAPKGPPPPFGIDPTACYDAKRDRIYVGGGSYPVAKGPNALWVYDVKNDTWIDPQPAGTCCGGSNSYNTNIAAMTYDQAADAVVLNLHKADGGGRPGLYVYRPDANAWDATPRPFAAGVTWEQVNGFYDPALNVHAYHSAGDSRPGGVVRVYRLGGRPAADDAKAGADAPLPVEADGVRTAAARSGVLSAAVAAPPENARPAVPFFAEPFDDDRLTTRGWYDGSRFRIARDARAGTGCVEYEWPAGGTAGTGSSVARRLFEPTDEVYVRFYIRLSKGFGWTGKGFHPHLIQLMTTENGKFAGPAATHLTLYVEPCDGKLRLAAQDIQNKDRPHGLTQGPIKGGYNGTFFDSKDALFTDDQWHCVEARFKLNTLDPTSGRPNRDGVAQGWFDGRLVIDRADVVFRSPDFPDMRLNQLVMAPYFGPRLLPHAQRLWLDEMVVGRHRAGPLPVRPGATPHP